MTASAIRTPVTTVDVISDVACPWCYLGKRRLEQAIELLPDVNVVVRWHPFQLDPTIPRGGIDRREYLERKFGSLDEIAPAHANLTAIGEREGIAYRFDEITRSPNTIDAHRLIRWASLAGRADAMVEGLFRAYFSDGVDIGDRLALIILAEEAGMPGDTAARLASEEDRDTIKAEVEEIYRMGVSGVPCFIIDNRYAVVGAHPAEILVNAIGRAIAERAPEAVLPA